MLSREPASTRILLFLFSGGGSASGGLSMGGGGVDGEVLESGACGWTLLQPSVGPGGVANLQQLLFCICVFLASCPFCNCVLSARNKGARIFTLAPCLVLTRPSLQCCPSATLCQRPQFRPSWQGGDALIRSPHRTARPGDPALRFPCSAAGSSPCDTGATA